MEQITLGAKKAAYTVVLGDKSYPVKKPKLGFQEKTQSLLQKAVENKENALPVLYKWAEYIGIPADEVKAHFDIDDLMDLFSVLSQPKKKQE